MRRRALDELLRAAKVATFGERTLPLPDGVADLLAASLARINPPADFTDPRAASAEQLLASAVCAVLVFPRSRPALVALKAAADVVDALDALSHAALHEPAEGERWEKRAGLMS